MEKKTDLESKPQEELKKRAPEYEPPKIITYNGDQLLKELGPAQACSPFGGSVIGC